MQGYKVFNPDWTTNHSDIIFEVGETYRIAGAPELGKKGLHFCEEPYDCFDYFDFDLSNHVCCVEASGDIDSHDGKACTNELTIVREMSWGEVCGLVRARAPFCRIRLESGFGNVGPGNSGSHNAGKNNKGAANSGNSNSGWKNAGDENAGSRNAGDRNGGEGNSGDGNAGDFNAGCGNEGIGNAGDRNSGRRNAGSGNIGNWNAGSWNAGSRNAGSFNSGDVNIGDWNAGKRRIGCFCTEEDTGILVFDRPSCWTAGDWFHSRARRLLERLPNAYMGETGRSYDGPSDDRFKAYAQTWWEALPSPDVACILLLPNFDAEKFLTCTGIDVRRHGKADDVQDRREEGEAVGLGADVQATDPDTDREYENEHYRPPRELVDLLDLL